MTFNISAESETVSQKMHKARNNQHFHGAVSSVEGRPCRDAAVEFFKSSMFFLLRQVKMSTERQAYELTDTTIQTRKKQKIQFLHERIWHQQMFSGLL